MEGPRRRKRKDTCKARPAWSRLGEGILQWVCGRSAAKVDIHSDTEIQWYRLVAECIGRSSFCNRRRIPRYRLHGTLHSGWRHKSYRVDLEKEKKKSLNIFIDNQIRKRLCLFFSMLKRISSQSQNVDFCIQFLALLLFFFTLQNQNRAYLYQYTIKNAIVFAI